MHAHANDTEFVHPRGPWWDRSESEITSQIERSLITQYLRTLNHVFVGFDVQGSANDHLYQDTKREYWGNGYSVPTYILELFARVLAAGLTPFLCSAIQTSQQGAKGNCEDIIMR